MIWNLLKTNVLLKLFYSEPSAFQLSEFSLTGVGQDGRQTGTIGVTPFTSPPDGTQSSRAPLIPPLPVWETQGSFAMDLDLRPGYQPI